MSMRSWLDQRRQRRELRARLQVELATLDGMARALGVAALLGDERAIAAYRDVCARRARLLGLMP